MSLSIIQQFSFNGKCVRSVYVSGEECLLSRDVYEAIGYDEQSGVQAIQRHVPRKYRLRFGDLLVKNDQLHHNTVLLKEAGLYCFLLRCKRPRAEPFMEWVCEEVLPREVRKLAAAVEEKDKMIDEKDMQIALLDDDLTESQDLVKQLEFSNTGMQGEIRAKDQQIAHLEQRYVHLLAEEKKNYGMTIIAKNDESAEYPYISICGQHGYRKQKKRVVLLKNPGSTEFTDGDTPNAIVTYNLWREHRLIETNPQKPRDFKLVNMEENQLLQMQE